ncbi:hypothetical protein L6R50_21350 [Myxococcota bacterium]|nr:hypothetical protein [Myxococcota bacterium]
MNASPLPLHLVEVRGEWIRLRLPGGASGWVRARDIHRVLGVGTGVAAAARSRARADAAEVLDTFGRLRALAGRAEDLVRRAELDGVDVPGLRDLADELRDVVAGRER